MRKFEFFNSIDVERSFRSATVEGDGAPTSERAA
jgi:hypothetical protein